MSLKKYFRIIVALAALEVTIDSGQRGACVR
jgi:hypothetical protein